MDLDRMYPNGSSNVVLVVEVRQQIHEEAR